MSTRFMLNMFAGPNKFVDLRKAWKCFTVEGGTNNWIQKLAKGFRERCRVNTAVESVKRVTGKDGQPRVEVTTEAHGTETYDHVVSGEERAESERRGEREKGLRGGVYIENRFVKQRLYCDTCVEKKRDIQHV